MKVLFWIFLSLSPIDCLADISILATPEGEVISDVDAGLNSDPELPWSTDPFIKIPGNIARPAEDDSDIALQATSLAGNRPSAIINDRILQAGDKVKDRYIREIGNEYVLMEKGGSIIEVGLYEKQEGAKNRAPAALETEPEIRIEEIKP